MTPPSMCGLCGSAEAGDGRPVRPASAIRAIATTIHPALVIPCTVCTTGLSASRNAPAGAPYHGTGDEGGACFLCRGFMNRPRQACGDSYRGPHTHLSSSLLRFHGLKLPSLCYLSMWHLRQIPRLFIFRSLLLLLSVVPTPPPGHSTVEE